MKGMPDHRIIFTCLSHLVEQAKKATSMIPHHGMSILIQWIRSMEKCRSTTLETKDTCSYAYTVQATQLLALLPWPE
jgi:hypothetical protein